MRIVLVTGTSKGLGLELAKHYLNSDCMVIGISRSKVEMKNDNYFHCTTDIMEDSCISELGQFLDALSVKKIDILINNAGTGSYGYRLSEVDPQEVLDQVNLHCIGALRIAKAVQRYLKASVIVNVTSRLGSVYQAERGDFSQREFSYSYRIAKCAQNMLSLCMSNDSELTGNRIISINPGQLKTDSGSEDANVTAADGARAFAKVVDTVESDGVYHAFGEAALY